MALRRALDRIGRRLPHGWNDFLLQVAIWLAFVLCYQLARGLADRGPDVALRNAWRVVELEERLLGLFEIDVQRLALDAGQALVHAANWTYWLSQFVVVTAALLWVYLRRNDAYVLLRNALIVVNTLGLIGYVALPTAPPRMLGELGFLDTLAGSEALNHGSGVVELASNQYAAMPSLHAADALVVGVALGLLIRNPLLRALCFLYPAWVWFSLIATANHFWLDVVAGIALAVIGTAVAWLFTKDDRTRRRSPRPGASRHELRTRGSSAIGSSPR